MENEEQALVEKNSQILDFIGRWRVRYNRGILYTSIPIALFNSISLSILWLPYLREWGIPTWVVYAGVPTAFLAVTLWFGYVDEKKELWKRETVQFNETSNPYLPLMLKSYKEIEEIHAILKEMKNEKRMLPDCKHDVLE